MKTGKQKVLDVLKNILLIIYAVFALFPLIWMILISFKSDTEVFTTTFVFNPTLANYQEVLLRSDYGRYILDSVIVSGGAVLVSIIVGVPAAYALARYNFPRKEDLAFQILSYKFAPEILVVLPLFMIYQKIGLYDSYVGLIWVYQ
ncbi:MAG: carbohydrate ABC transporter permease, partial [Lachnospiraceae bacterium]|nr:carbohydrate ABC transporter permease [Lachnospiraceae bacterium]